MLKRLLLTLLIACLAFPAAAAPLGLALSEAHHVAAASPCHGSPAGQEQAPSATPAKHQCIGCVTPVADVAPVGPAEPLVGLAAVGTEPKDLNGTSVPPVTPPPRT